MHGRKIVPGDPGRLFRIFRQVAMDLPKNFVDRPGEPGEREVRERFLDGRVPRDAGSKVWLVTSPLY